MNPLLARVQKLVEDGRVRISSHGFEELANDDIFLSEVLNGLPTAVSVEEFRAITKDLAYSLFRLWMTEAWCIYCGASRRILPKP